MKHVVIKEIWRHDGSKFDIKKKIKNKKKKNYKARRD